MVSTSEEGRMRHRSGRRFDPGQVHDGADYLSALEEGIESWEPGELNVQHNGL